MTLAGAHIIGLGDKLLVASSRPPPLLLPLNPASCRWSQAGAEAVCGLAGAAPLLLAATTAAGPKTDVQPTGHVAGGRSPPGTAVAVAVVALCGRHLPYG
jgi:hypothetical protein